MEEISVRVSKTWAVPEAYRPTTAMSLVLQETTLVVVPMRFQFIKQLTVSLFFLSDFIFESVHVNSGSS
jgi:hypothetical protein